ncbi:hypothetical protein Ae406Ps2_0124c [Pseudonocardia sp. Ae406_Ps2]|nr:hypothetical protein Ae406Ps2_0124c [Pseudonocardia sp. Ae406_Ps2]OLM08082.1 hypothetical protein Ae331Ps2_5792 [Pseudonocardia sp. Ae331_Ps2]OLM13686.1 hypothetical protein Ae505Ps2_3814c [Pseudonocardia sp. Ae505_Ps2]OLM21693.1 hypothetical protein Ae706Ps2_0125c [Pseudonocardia sp. Ae706_Ps2]
MPDSAPIGSAVAIMTGRACAGGGRAGPGQIAGGTAAQGPGTA